MAKFKNTNTNDEILAFETDAEIKEKIENKELPKWLQSCFELGQIKIFDKQETSDNTVYFIIKNKGELNFEVLSICHSGDFITKDKNKQIFIIKRNTMLTNYKKIS